MATATCWQNAKTSMTRLFESGEGLPVWAGITTIEKLARWAATRDFMQRRKKTPRFGNHMYDFSYDHRWRELIMTHGTKHLQSKNVPAKKRVIRVG